MRKRLSARAKAMIVTAGTVLLGLSIVPGASAAGIATTAAARTCAPSRAPAFPMSGRWRQNGWLSARNQAMSQHITSDQPRLRRQGIQLTEWGPDSRSGKIKIYLTHYTPAAAHSLHARYGCTVRVATVSEPIATLLGRGDDLPPYRGGDFLWVPSGNGFCSGGPIVRNTSGQLRMLMAGHCASGLDKFVYRSDRALRTDGPHMGNTTQRSFCNNCIDAAVVDNNSSGSSYSATLWGGGDSGIPNYTENGTAFPDPSKCSGGVPGCAADLVTNDSAFTGELTGLTVRAVNVTLNVCDPYISSCTPTPTNSITLTHLSRVSAGGSVVARAGDSGGPWVVHNGSGTVAVAGVTSSGTNCNQSGACTTAYYTQIGAIDSQFNETVP
jgi:hypothetical protein